MQPVPEPAPSKESRQDTGTQHPEQSDNGDDATQGARHRRQQLPNRLLVTVFLYSVITGTKAWLNAPSAKSRRKKLGMRLAKKKTSAATPAPSKLAMTTSRTKPITRDANVIPDTIMPDLINFLLKTRPLELSERKECC